MISFRTKLITVFLIILSMSITIFPSIGCAAPNSVNNTTGNGRLSYASATLSSDNGTSYSIKLSKQTKSLNKMVSSQMDINFNESTYIDEYAFKLDASSMTLLTSSSSSTHEWDPIGGDVEGTVSVYYNKVGTTYKITKVTGKFLSYSSGTGIRNKEYVIACNSGFSSNQYINESFTTTSFSRTTNFSQFADSAQGICSIGACISSEVYRIASGSHWDFAVYCTIAGRMPSIP